MHDSTITLEHLYTLARGHLPHSDLAQLEKAGAFAVERHNGKSYNYGGPFINHALNVAASLVSMKMDLGTIVAGLLHGVLNEGVATLEELQKLFGDDVANIVNGVTRITNVRYSSRLANQVENIRKYMLAMGADIRVLLVKLADRLQDMQSLGNAAVEERRYKARETMDLYAPLAGRVGIEWLKRELEDLSFSHLFPVEYENLSRQMDSTLGERQAYVDEVIGILYTKLRANKVVPVRIVGRPKHLYSIYKKLVVQKITVDQVYDKVAFRIIVRTVRECYQALGTVHADWPPVPGRIKDYISVPKANNYQSLHTTVAGPHGHFIEIQIRTEEMDRVAQEGVAAHWAYKEGQKVSQNDARLFRDIKQMVQTLQEVEDPTEFMESLKSELFEPDVFVLTPRGEVRELPQGSTPIDFAYAIHSDVGDTCVGAKVNGQIVQLKHTLQNGDIVEILTQKNQHPKRAWLQIVKTGRARTRIRQYLRKEENERSLKLGREICERELKKNGFSLQSLVKGGHFRLLLKELRCTSLDDMLIKVGSGALTMPTLLRTLQPEGYAVLEEQRRIEELQQRAQRQVESKPGTALHGSIDLDGMTGMPVKVSRCCRPIPGDAIIGFISTGSGISIHKADCRNLLATNSARWVDVQWPAALQQNYQSGLFIRAENKKSLLAAISSSISADDADIVELNARTTAENMAELELILEVRDLKHLQLILQHLQQIPEVVELKRR
ncbi:MAG: bifunctional (p)ppGpp synthetase/guanosine-3',5'-bis(diphosphate) 3'-pyrophosphohydrolase [Desulfobulbaceae bacterium]|nr:bifunctional (p)ppGpp synthetase/guanosine-3',5'-bis(diphosphate) 3'-pyrophosphohydrolase [Desulfobulbaceae bacterium]